MSNLLICLFFVSNQSESLLVAHFWWATWAITSQLLFCHEKSEQFAHSHSFWVSNMSHLLTVPHLSWLIWANGSQSLIKMSDFEQMSDERMSEWANSQPWVLLTIQHTDWLIILRYYLCIVPYSNLSIRVSNLE